MDETDHPIEYKPKSVSNNSVIETVKEYLANAGFQHRIVGDTPTDNNQLVPRKYVTMNGNTANRPQSSVIGQSYLDTQIGKVVWWNGTTFQDSQGNVV
jgi:hypothetical protein